VLNIWLYSKLAAITDLPLCRTTSNGRFIVYGLHNGTMAFVPDLNFLQRVSAHDFGHGFILFV